MKEIRLVLVLFLLLFTSLAFPQSPGDSLFASRVLSNITNYYSDHLLSGEAPIYNGRVYQPHAKLSDDGHVFFNSARYAEGSVVYDGHSYRNVKMLYDLVKGQLIVLHLDGFTAIALASDPVDSFSLHGHTFIHLRAGEEDKRIKPGYYDLLYDGRINLLAARVKSVSERVTQTQVEKSVLQQNKYYLLKDSVYTEIRNKNTLLKLLRSTHSQNQQFMKLNRLNFKRDKEGAILKLVQFHDSLILK